MRGIKEQVDEDCNFSGEETYIEIMKGVIENGRIKDFSSLIIRTQDLEAEKSVGVDCSVGFGIVNACIGLVFLDKALSIQDKMNAQGASVGIGVYSSIFKA